MTPPARADASATVQADDAAPSHRWRAVLTWTVLASLVAGAGVIGWTRWTLSRRYRDAIYEDAVAVSAPVAIVFGAGYWPSGRLSNVLMDRLDGAIELYEAGSVRKLLFSGDNRIEDYNEPEAMLNYALRRNVPREDIVLDYAGRRTYATCYRARDIFQVDRAVLVTQRYHQPRALLTCRTLGLNAVGYAADRRRYVDIEWYRLREIPALWLAWWQLRITRPEPILGEPLPIFAED
jgi:SanA protein